MSILHTFEKRNRVVSFIRYWIDLIKEKPMLFAVMWLILFGFYRTTCSKSSLKPTALDSRQSVITKEEETAIRFYINQQQYKKLARLVDALLIKYPNDDRLLDIKSELVKEGIWNE